MDPRSSLLAMRRRSGVVLVLVSLLLGLQPSSLAQDTDEEATVEDSEEASSEGRRGTGERDRVGSDPRRGGQRDDVVGDDAERPTEAQSERLRDLPTGESPTSVTPQSIQLPTGEGSIEGMGESFAPVLSSGTATFSVPIALPPGRHGVQPSFGLSYGSSNGNGIVGIGWSIGVPMISRQTDRGTPRYVDSTEYRLGEDRFIYNGGQELVPVDNGAMAIVDSGSADVDAVLTAIPQDVVDWQQYRAKVEGSFMRFFRDPNGKRWVVQSLDGSRFDFGLLPTSDGPPTMNRTGALQSEGANGTGRVYAWLLTRMSDAHGSTVYYQYEEHQGARYLSDVYYLSPASCASGMATSPRLVRRCSSDFADYGVRVRFEYESRPDAFTSYVSGWGITQARRLVRITSFSAEANIGERFFVRRYLLSYDPSSFHSLLASVQVQGRKEQPSGRGPVPVFQLTSEGDVGATFDGRRLPPMRFEYSTMPQSGQLAAGFGGLDATVRLATNSPPVSLDAALVDLFDVNSDGLMDVLVTDGARYRTPDGRPGVGVFWNGFAGPNAIPAERGATFSAATVLPLETGAEVVLRYTNPNLLGMDVDGDGRGDFMHLPPTLGHGWITPARLQPTPASSPRLQNWAFVHSPRPLQAGLDPQIRLAQDGTFFRVVDVNNDHMIDIVRTTGTSMQTWLNLGWIEGGEGRFGHAELANGAWVIRPEPITTCLPHDGLPLDFGSGEVRLGDMNGDGLSDLIRMRRGRITYWPGRGGPVWGEGPTECSSGFASNRHIDMTAAPSELNTDLAGVFLQDVDGDGADDVVQVRYRELDVWFNRAGRSFTTRITILSPYAPDYAPNLRFVDLDGSGTTDLVYGRANDWRYLDLLGGKRPRLLTRVHNNLGATTAIEYGSSIEDYLRDLRASAECVDANCERFTWDGIRGDLCDEVIDTYAGECVYRSGGSPVVSSVVRRVQVTDNFGQVVGRSQIATQEYTYHNGYYEGIEQEFRGFGAADAHALGDSTVGGLRTRTWFHQGRRPNEIASTRLQENPDEPLKGSTFLTEEFDEGGRHASTTFASFTVRRLATGLDGRAISLSYGHYVDSFTYDTSTYAASGTAIELPWIEREIVSSTTGGSTSYSPEMRTVRIRAERYVRTRTESGNVDNFGRAVLKAELGRVHGLEDGAGTSEVDYGDGRVTLEQRASVGNDEEGWLVRPALTAVADLHLSTIFGMTQHSYSDAGDEVRTTQTVDVATDLDFGGDAHAPGYVYGTQEIETSSSVDAFGNVESMCGGANLLEDEPTECLRYRTTEYDDAAYSQNPVRESTATAVDASESGGFRMLVTTATWNRGFGSISSSTDTNGAVTAIGYDGLARTTYSDFPNGIDCPAVDAEQLVVYRLPDELGLPIGYVETTIDVRETNSGSCGGEKRTRSRIYVDSLGRARGNMLNTFDEQPGLVLLSGVIEIDARGNSSVAYDPSWIAGDWQTISPQTAFTKSGTALATVSTFDPFGRLVSSTAQDGSTARIVHHANETWTFDPNDDPQQNPASSQHWGTPTIERVDGLGRSIERVQLLRQPGEAIGSIRYLHLVSKYRPDGHVVGIVRAETSSTAPFEAADIQQGRIVERTFVYDTAGRRVTATDPDTDSRDPTRGSSNRHWRYLFNPVGDLAAVRDPRGCGQDFFYDRAGRLIAEDYVTCSEAQSGGDGTVGSVGGGDGDAIGYVPLVSARAVDVVYTYDALPTWVPGGVSPSTPASAALHGRATGIADRAQRSATSFDARGNAVWTARQVAVIPEEADLDGPEHVLTTIAPAVDEDDGAIGNQAAPVYDETVDHTYAIRTYFDAAGRPFKRTYPRDPDWDSEGGAAAPTVAGRMAYNVRGLPISSTIELNGVLHQTVLASATYDAYGAAIELRLRSTETNDAIVRNATYDNRHRPILVRTGRGSSTISGSPGTLNSVQVPFAELYDWDRASNLVRITSQAGPDVFPSGRRQMRRTIEHDSLSRVAQVSMDYLQDDRVWGPTDVARDWRAERERGTGTLSNRDVDPMRSEPSPMVVENAPERVIDLMYEYDWLANMTLWEDDAHMFYERSLGSISNGASDSDGTGANPDYRPSALYIASNIRVSSDEQLDSRAGWLDVDYGESGNVVSLTIRADCDDVATKTCLDNPELDVEAREAALLEKCACASEQHFEYRWDEVNRITEARRYDHDYESGEWRLAARMRARYDAGNVRIVKQSIDSEPESEGVAERVHLYAFPDEFERVGLQSNRLSAPRSYASSIDLGSETEYHIAGATLVHRTDEDLGEFDRRDRVTIPIGDLLGTASAVVDLDSGELLEMATFHPNGGREMHWMSETQRFVRERHAFTGKEEDEEVGLSYFGHRYLIQRIARWASPDPLAVHQNGGGEAINAYHFVDGNLLTSKDPDGLDPSPTPAVETALNTVQAAVDAAGALYDSSRPQASGVACHAASQATIEAARNERILTEAVLDPMSRVVAHGARSGPHVVPSLRTDAGEIAHIRAQGSAYANQWLEVRQGITTIKRGYFRVVDALVITAENSSVVTAIREGARNAKGFVLALDFKFGRATMRGVEGIVSRLGLRAFAVRPEQSILGQIRRFAGRIGVGRGMGFFGFAFDVGLVPQRAMNISREILRREEEEAERVELMTTGHLYGPGGIYTHQRGLSGPDDASDPSPE